MGISLKQLQVEQAEWAERNFPDSMKEGEPEWQLLGVTEEVGELCHAALKLHQSIRGPKDKHLEDMRDAIGDTIIFMAGLCTTMGFSLEDIVTETWQRVSKRNWQQNRKDGEI